MATEWTGESILRFCSFIDIRVLLTAAELDLFTPLSQEPMEAKRAATLLHADARALAAVLDALVSMGFLAKTNSEYSCPAEIARYLASNGSETVLPMLRHHVGIWDRASKLTAIVKPCPDGESSGLTSDEARRAFIEAMHVRARVNADANVAAMKIAGAKRLIDVGGGSGSYTIAILKTDPEMAATLFDLPPVVELARNRLASEGLIDRVTIAAGDFYADELPGGHDLALLSAIIHQNSPDENVALFRKILGALTPGGRLIIRDHVMSPDHTSPKSGALFAVNMLISTPGGGTYTLEEIRGALETAGFERIGLLRGDAEMECLVEAFRPRK